VDQTERFLVGATIDADKTAYGGYVWDSKTARWRHLVTFRVRTGGQPLRGLYSFVEDFRRDYESARQQRCADFGPGWVCAGQERWLPLTTARFTASSAEWEARESINAETRPPGFRLCSGGETQQNTPLRSLLHLDAVEAGQPPQWLTDSVRQLVRAPQTRVPGP
jgi:hypothetical protein